MKNKDLQYAKAAIRPWLALQSDSTIGTMLDMAREGKMSYWSCDHCLLGLSDGGYLRGRALDQGRVAESGFYLLASSGHYPELQSYQLARNLRMVPMLLAEIKRRSKHRVQEENPLDIPETVHTFGKELTCV